MKRSIPFLIIVLVLFNNLRLHGQPESYPVQSLSVGDTMPEVLFKKMLNYKSSRAKLSDFKGKWVILDFWSSFCAACISGFPYMDSLQQVFGSDLQIILVNGKSGITGDDSSKISKILQNVKRRTGAGMTMPVVWDCPLLDSLFTYNYIPHEVWIDPQGRVAAITNAGEVTAANIRSMIEGKQVKLRLKKDIAHFDAGKSLLSLINETSENNLYYHSLITGYQEGLHGMYTRRSGETPDKVAGFYVFNVTPENLFRTAYSNTTVIDVPANRLLVELEKPEQFSPLSDSDIYSYSYCYDIRVSPTGYENLMKYMQQDLERFFPFKVSPEERVLPCLILRATPALAKSRTKGGDQETDMESRTIKKYVHNYSIGQFVDRLNQFCPLPVFAELDISYNIDIDLPYELKDVSAMIRSLQKAGFDVRKENRQVKVAVVSEK